jgi:peptidoglycan/xylan/chitin deacetylase (PgdA/CDA1 family)
MALGPASVARRAMKSLASLAPAHPGTVVLIYHRVGAGSGLEIDLDPALFDRQLAALAATGDVVGLGDAVESLRTPSKPGPDHTEVRRDTVVTFDDGTADFVEEALPILVEHGVPAVLYVATGLVDEGRPFPLGGTPLSWSAIADAASTGLVTVASHTHSHALLDRCPTAIVAGELDRSIDLIAEHVGRRPEHFAYPKALPGSDHAAAEVARRFRSAALAGTRSNRYGATDPMRLARSPIQRSDGMRWFRRKIQGGMALEDDVRRVANRFRYAGASS